jgi:hypothetical protein
VDDEGDIAPDPRFKRVYVPGSISPERWESHFSDDLDELLPPPLDEELKAESLNGMVIATIAMDVQSKAAGLVGGMAAVGERSVLQPVAVDVLKRMVADRAGHEHKLDIPYWPNVGGADLVVWRDETRAEVQWAAELKWCSPGRDVLYEAIWDLFKMALATTREDRPKAYLITGAPRSIWDGSRFAELFEDAVHDPAELCSRRLATKKQEYAWDATLVGGYEKYPSQLPARVRTTIVQREAIGGDWELRSVRVEPEGDDWITMTGGWPDGQRPPNASYPSL